MNKTLTKEKSIDVLLDQYNEYIMMYKVFCDIEYKNMANLIIAKLKRVV